MYNHDMKSALHLCIGVAAIVTIAACASREVEKDLKIVDVHTGWYDLGVVDGQNKLVPSISLKLENVSQEEIANVQLNAVFRRVGEQQTWGDHFVRGIGREPLAPGAETGSLVLRSPRGYTGSQSRLAMLENKEFVDAKVDIFGKHGSRTWQKLGEFQMDRQLLTE
jgi:hypothetical protein